MSVELAAIIAIALGFTAGNALVDPWLRDLVRDYHRRWMGDCD